ncbi:hypothetical protein [Phaeacidiphilus oryzae]|uniref:hypothetical protein n=1 Tax=Phaeacidiphilus oryzae TaxID=348818 RepID=UPI00056441EB|nr:hypothetical protein [Phaeacidiphilus oryzae]
MDTVYSLASGALGVALAAVAWLIAHSQQILKVVSALPTVQKDLETVKASVEEHMAAVKSGTETTGRDVEQLAETVAKKLTGFVSAPAISPTVDSTPDTPAPAAAPAATAETATTAVVPGTAYAVTADASGRLVLPDGSVLTPAA